MIIYWIYSIINHVVKNKVSVGEPAEGSLVIIIKLIKLINLKKKRRKKKSFALRTINGKEHPFYCFGG